MKKVFYFLFSASVLFACNTNSGKIASTENPEEHSHDMKAPVAENAGPESRLSTGVPELNNGAKWVADESTNHNVALLQSIVSTFREKADPKPEDYGVFREEFTKGLNKMVQECKMKGADHDALHVWLEPLMEDNKELGAAKTESEMKKAVESISDRLSIYPAYFE